MTRNYATQLCYITSYNYSRQHFSCAFQILKEENFVPQPFVTHGPEAGGGTGKPFLSSLEDGGRWSSSSTRSLQEESGTVGGDGRDDNSDPPSSAVAPCLDDTSVPNHCAARISQGPGQEEEEDESFILVPEPGLPSISIHDCLFNPQAVQSPNTKLRRAPNECSICLCEYSVGSDVVWSSNPLCEHVFHETCIEQWLMKQRGGPLCPCCRRDFVIDPFDLGQDEEEVDARVDMEVGMAPTNSSDDEPVPNATDPSADGGGSNGGGASPSSSSGGGSYPAVPPGDNNSASSRSINRSAHDQVVLGGINRV
jgi:Ring finger domain